MNKYLDKDTFNILNELDLSHSGELVYEEKVGWWIDTYHVKNKDAIQDLVLLRLVNCIEANTKKQILKITDEGLSCLSNDDYVPVIARPPIIYM